MLKICQQNPNLKAMNTFDLIKVEKLSNWLWCRDMEATIQADIPKICRPLSQFLPFTPGNSKVFPDQPWPTASLVSLGIAPRPFPQETRPKLLHCETLRLNSENYLQYKWAVTQRCSQIIRLLLRASAATVYEKLIPAACVFIIRSLPKALCHRWGWGPLLADKLTALPFASACLK